MFFVFILFLLPLRAFAVEYDAPITNPWDLEDVLVEVTPLENSSRSAELPLHPALLPSIAQSAIRFYQHRIAGESTSRCPFHISCSRFAQSAITRHGSIKGVAMFIDRYFFREHMGSQLYYPLRETWRGKFLRLKLDDSYYLE